TVGKEKVYVTRINDKKLGRMRSQLKGKASWSLPANMHLDVKANHLSDNDYLADFSHDVKNATKRYVSSIGTLSWAGEYGGWQLFAQHQRDLLRQSNDATLQILPRFQSNLAVPVLDRFATVHFDQQTTRFDRRRGVNGWRTYLHPYLEVPFSLAAGGVSGTLHAGGEQTRYWLKDYALSRKPVRNSGEFSAEVHSVFERVSDTHLLRHTIEPTLRYDIINVSDQSQLPNFDSAFGRLSMSNLLTGNRYSGHDIVQSTNRVSFLLGSRLQSKEDAKASAETLLLAHVGLSYDLRRRNSVTGQPLNTPPFSNIVGDLSVNPLPGLSFSADGQYDSSRRFFDTAHAGVNWTSDLGHELHIAYLYTDARYSTRAQLVRSSAKARVADYWHILGTWYYDINRKRSAQFSWGFNYEHPCWSLKVEAYKIVRPTGTSSVPDTGVRFLIGFEGVGSVGAHG
ncbi:MAG TPA: LPS-assembly protein LptD, partial [Mariprofundaceae bacterium]|nr:LPS-assembly protein LptD [Mariprofundaceae bacterium]